MTGEERREARYQRRKAEREWKKQKVLSEHDDFERIADVNNLYRSFTQCMRGVAWKESIQRYQMNELRNLAQTRRKLLAGESVRGGFVEFIRRERGKVRQIKSIHISERVVQKCLCDQVLTPILTKPLIFDNGASVKGKGTHFAFRRLILHLSKYYRKHKTNDGYALLVDFKKYFDSIDHQTLFRSLEVYIKDPRVRSLIRDFVSAFGEGKSLGLGSQVSQNAAIFQPNRVDHLCKHALGIKYYGRYMDDLYLIHESKDHLKYCLSGIEKVCNELKITINERKTKIVKLKHGVEFLQGKYKLLESGKVLRLPLKDSTKRVKRKLKKFKKLLEKGKITFQNARESYQSWRKNYMKRFNAYYRVVYMDRLYNGLFVFDHTQNQKKKGDTNERLPS